MKVNSYTAEMKYRRIKQHTPSSPKWSQGVGFTIIVNYPYLFWGSLITKCQVGCDWGCVVHRFNNFIVTYNVMLSKIQTLPKFQDTVLNKIIVQGKNQSNTEILLNWCSLKWLKPNLASVSMETPEEGDNYECERLFLFIEKSL